MEPIIKPGMVKFGSYKGTGKLLLTSRHIYALSDDNSAGMTGGMIGGVVGALIGSAIDSVKHRATQPEYFSDPDLASLDDSQKKSLRKTALLVKLNLSEDLSVTPTFAGFDFAGSGTGPLCWRGLIHKAKIRKFLEANGVSILPKK